jgi:hypothetical protein
MIPSEETCPKHNVPYRLRSTDLSQVYEQFRDCILRDASHASVNPIDDILRNRSAIPLVITVRWQT